MHDSDWFDGLCPCNDFPCKRSVEAQTKYEAGHAVYIRLRNIYYQHHQKYPTSSFINAIIKDFGLWPI